MNPLMTENLILIDFPFEDRVLVCKMILVELFDDEGFPQFPEFIGSQFDEGEAFSFPPSPFYVASVQIQNQTKQRSREILRNQPRSPETTTRKENRC
jgi:hypothetical protein